uniref:Glucosamine-phosphate N-acetyltransferase n=1 Tax=Globodera pallida TaxID=36090 RepID=A0A183BKY4_GLOPA
MLSVQQLISSSKLERVLPGHLFPQNNNRGLTDLEDVCAITVVVSSADSKIAIPSDSEDTSTAAEVVGFGLFHKCTPCQTYCSLVSVTKQFEQPFVNVERVAARQKAKTEAENERDAKKGGRHLLLRLTEVRESLPDLSTLPQYFTAFAEPCARPLLQCIVDEFVKVHFGIHGMETLRNFTVDLYDSEAGIDEHPDTQWRDFAGFIVADRFRYCEIELDGQALLSAVDDVSVDVRPPVVVQPLSSSNRALFHDYDQSLSVIGREEYLDFLLNTAGMKAVIALDEQQRQPIGYVLAYAGRVLQCYADEEKVAGGEETGLGYVKGVGKRV